MIIKSFEKYILLFHNVFLDVDQCFADQSDIEWLGISENDSEDQKEDPEMASQSDHESIV